MSGIQERTYIMIKPDGVQRGLIGDVIKRFERKGFKLVALKFISVSLHVIDKFICVLNKKVLFLTAERRIVKGTLLRFGSATFLRKSGEVHVVWACCSYGKPTKKIQPYVIDY